MAEINLPYPSVETLSNLIRRNFALNNMQPNLEQAAIATHDGEMAFHMHENIISSLVVDRDETSATQVPC